MTTVLGRHTTFSTVNVPCTYLKIKKKCWKLRDYGALIINIEKSVHFFSTLGGGYYVYMGGVKYVGGIS